ncbi:MAG: deoxyguanosinetriphosphate triphosphohydrolase [Fimbriimonas sp.]
MPHHVRELTERRELETLSPYAAKAAESQGRQTEEAPDPVRTVFQRDRDRVLHCKPFRRMKHKTQVFIDPTGDHYRTRMTHSLEVSQIARTIGRALRLNEDLIEAIALGHDMGHTPFGHAGESALDEAIKEYRAATGDPECPEGFRHDLQSLRIVDHLERLNLTHETRMGIGGHSKGSRDLTAYDGQPTSTLEAAVVRISDRIAYLNHDLDDALRSGIIDAVPDAATPLGDTHSKRTETMVLDVINQSLDRPAIMISPSILGCLNELKEWMFTNVYYRYPQIYPDVSKARELVKALFRHFVQPGNLPPGYEGAQGAIDYLAGMSDRFAIDTYVKLKLPSAWKLP